MKRWCNKLVLFVSKTIIIHAVAWCTKKSKKETLEKRKYKVWSCCQAIEMSSHYLMVANFWISTNQAKKKRKKLTCKTFLCTITLRKIKMVAHTFHLSLVNHFKNNNCRDSENFATMVTWHQSSSLHETLLVSEMELMIAFILGGNSWESWCNHFWTHGIHVI